VSLTPLENPDKQLYAVLNIPSANLPRFTELPMLGHDYYLVFLIDVIRENIAEVFPGMQCRVCIVSNLPEMPK
jgi:polyphosphate kinase